jgi:mannosyltransferase
VEDISDVEIIAPNFKRRLSGVTSTIVQLIPIQRARGQKIATIGPGLPKSLPYIGYGALLKLWARPKNRRRRVWHARRNIEMLPGLFLRDILRMPIKLLFTSAAQRRHSGWTRFLISKMDAVIATSARSGSFLQVPHTVIQHGIDLNMFHPPAMPADTIAATGLPGKYLVGCFGRVRHQKGTDLFVRAMVELLPLHPDWTAVVCGRVTTEHRAFADDLEKLVERSGLSERIRFLGEVADIKPWYRRLSLYVAPSRNEGFGLTPLEAMASTTAVVASNAGAYEEMVVTDQTGSVVAAGDYEALRDAIRPYLADPAMTARHALNGLDHVHANFAIEREAASIATLYAALLNS